MPLTPGLAYDYGTPLTLATGTGLGSDEVIAASGAGPSTHARSR
jgi:hypothetical protein